MKNQSAIIIVIAIAALFISYNAFVVVPQQRIEAQAKAQKEAQEAKEWAEFTRQASIDSCLDSAYQAYSMNWDTACENIGKKANCGLPNYKSSALEETMDNAKALCLKRY